VSIKYRFAFNENGLVACADDLRGQLNVGVLYCIGCGLDLIARVNGNINSPHFAHKSQVECSGETYLHKLAKYKFFEVYRHCLAEGQPFKVRLTASRRCYKYQPVLMKKCDLGEVEHDFDLTQYYQDIFLEKRDGEFIPDLLLRSRSNPENSIYIEIAVTHFLSEKKEASHNRIIEIPIESEEDIKIIEQANLSPRNAMFMGFNQLSTAVSDSECKCAREKFYVFYVYQNGKALLDFDSLRSIVSLVNSRRNQLIYSNIFWERQEKFNEFSDHGEERGRVFRDQLNLAISRGIRVKNCYLCRFQGDNWDATNNFSIFCKTLRKPCNSNEAATCGKFWMRD